MPRGTHIQRDFSGGEVSGRVFMRNDTDMYRKSVAAMRNFIGTLQGSAVRTPGTRFIQQLANGTRIVPFLTQDNQESLVLFGPSSASGVEDGPIEILFDIADIVTDTVTDGPTVPGVTTTVFQNIVKNGDFREGSTNWWLSPGEVIVEGGALGCRIEDNAVVMTAREGFKSGEPNSIFIAQTMTLPKDTDELSIRANFVYSANFSSLDADVQFGVNLGTTEFGSEIYKQVYTQDNIEVGTNVNTPVSITTFEDDTPLSLLAGSKVYFSFFVTAIGTTQEPSTPAVVFYNLSVQSKADIIISKETSGFSPYSESELPLIQYVQSPYPATDGSGGKELVVVYPEHHPKRLRFAGASYQFQDMPFFYADKDDGTPQTETPSLWQDSFPSCCTSFNGRLILAGGNETPAVGLIQGAPNETVWGSYVGTWIRYTDPNATDITPADSIEFTAIYRSPIKWVYGQKELLLGSVQYEYVGHADGIFQPADIGVSMHSSHGSVGVQPVAIGETVLFAAEGGRRVRAMNFREDTDGYTAPDMTFWHPYLFQSPIVRGFRMRNPHQIAGWVMGNGQIALLSIEPQVGVMGWSRINLGDPVKDACVLKNAVGQDVLFVTVERTDSTGNPALFLEAFSDWTEFTNNEYLQSSVRYTLAGTNIATGLDHLEGKIVQVVADGNYLGNYTVTGGQVELVDQLGQPINASDVLVGLPMKAVIQTLPIITDDPGSTKRFNKIEVRGVFTSTTLINGVRPPERSPSTFMGQSEPLSFFIDYEVANLGSDKYQVIRIEENLPLRSEVIGIFGTLKASSVS